MIEYLCAISNQKTQKDIKAIYIQIKTYPNGDTKGDLPLIQAAIVKAESRHLKTAPKIKSFPILTSTGKLAKWYPRENKITVVKLDAVQNHNKRFILIHVLTVWNIYLIIVPNLDMGTETSKVMKFEFLWRIFNVKNYLDLSVNNFLFKRNIRYGEKLFFLTFPVGF